MKSKAKKGVVPSRGVGVAKLIRTVTRKLDRRPMGVKANAEGCVVQKLSLYQWWVLMVVRDYVERFCVCSLTLKHNDIGSFTNTIMVKLCLYIQKRLKGERGDCPPRALSPDTWVCTHNFPARSDWLKWFVFDLATATIPLTEEWALPSSIDAPWML